jgi:dimethylaniline monooxygenase (N-oxide forming)
VNVYRSDSSGTTANSIILKDGREVPTDVLLCGTGWKSSYPFFSSKQASELGLPSKPPKDSVEEQSCTALMDAADERILRQYPILARPLPDCKPISEDSPTPARLYQGMASLTDPSIVFLGRARMSNNFRGAEAQAIWATAYWDGHVKLPPLMQAQEAVAYQRAFCRRRYPSRGADGLNFHADLV